MRSISGIWKSSFLFAVVAALLAFSVPAFAAPDINRIAFEGNSKVKTDILQEQVRSRAAQNSTRRWPMPTSRD